MSDIQSYKLLILAYIDLNLISMKSYLNDFNIHGNGRESNCKIDPERVKNKSQKSSIRNKVQLRSVPESHNSISTHPKSKSKSIKRNHTPILEVKPRGCHERIHSELDPSADDRPGSGFGKTLSKNRLKTQIGSYNAETLHVIKKEIKPVKIEDNFITGLVKARLQVERKHKKSQGQEIKKITELAHEVRGKASRNPENGEEYRGTRKSLEQGFESIFTQLRQMGQSGREQALCELVQALLGRLKHDENSEEGQRLLRVLRELEERNVRLMRLVNYMKGRGVDVDLYWNQSALS